jgi:hypothetical protein
MNVTRIPCDSCLYPAALWENKEDRPALVAAGNLDLLGCRLLGLFCSIRCPGDAIVQTYDLVRAVRDAGIPVIGGFHSPMEKECAGGETTARAVGV